MPHFPVLVVYFCPSSFFSNTCLRIFDHLPLIQIQMEGFQEFEARRKKKFDKQIDSNVMISSKGLDEGVDH